MHTQFRGHLENAKGQSEFIIAVNLDIRGFSSFSKNVESPDVAMYIKRIYMKLIDNYFPILEEHGEVETRTIIWHEMTY